MRRNPLWLVALTVLWILALFAVRTYGMATIWADDFESGDALAVSYNTIVNAESNATCGQGGGWGCRTTGTASQQHYGRLRYDLPTPLTTTYIRASFDADRSALLAGEVGAWNMVLHDDGASYFVELYHGDDVDYATSQLFVNSYWLPDFLVSAVGVITPGTWQTVVLEVWSSTHVLNGGFYEPNFDGRIKVSVDGVAVIDEDGLQVGGAYAVVNGTNRVEGVTFGPSGNGDNVGIYDADATTWVDIPNFVEQEIPSAAFPSGAARVVCECWSVDGSAMQVRLWNDTDSTSVGESASVSSATPTDATFAVTLTSGAKVYKLQVTGDVGVDLFCRAVGVMG